MLLSKILVAPLVLIPPLVLTWCLCCKPPLVLHFLFIADDPLAELFSHSSDFVHDSDHSADDIISATGGGTGLLVVDDVTSANGCGTGLLLDTSVDADG